DIETHFNLTQQLQPEEELTVYDFEAQDEELFDKNRFFKKYHSYSTYLKLLRHWSKKYPKYVEYDHSIGKSVEGRNIVGFRISNFRARNLKQKIWFNSGQHAREWVGPASQFFIMSNLLRLAEDDKHMPELLINYEFVFTPFSNPDGFEYARTKDRLWRKNRKRNYDGSYGVDLNRNWDDHWNVVGGSKDPSDETYVGTGPFSEAETKAISDYILKQGDLLLALTSILMVN
ncbi:Zn-dependent exopeptidase, partial [Conidiobolus coronatus NRRL 28638]